jgi:hypothetical protein
VRKRKEYPFVVIEIRGGCLVAVYSNVRQGCELRDWDNISESDAGTKNKALMNHTHDKKKLFQIW